MSRNYLSCIITHGKMADCLKGISERLVTPATAMHSYTNLEHSIEYLEEEIRRKMADLNPEKTILFVDLAGGSCWHLANRIKRGRDDVAVLAGVNVPALVSYHINCDRLEWDELIEKVCEDGKKGILTR